MKDTSVTSFGLVIAFLIPGFGVLWGLSGFSPTVEQWLGASPTEAPAIGGFLYGTLASIAAGLIVSAIRWAAVDSLHHATGVKPPRWDFSQLQKNVQAFDVLVEVHYRYYQFYANTLVAFAVVYCANRWAEQGILARRPVGWLDAMGVGLAIILWIASRDTLRKYYSRTASILARRR